MAMNFFSQIFRNSQERFSRQRLESAKKSLSLAEIAYRKQGNFDLRKKLYNQATGLLNPTNPDEFPLYFEAALNSALALIEQGRKTNALTELKNLGGWVEKNSKTEKKAYYELSCAYATYRCRSELEPQEREILRADLEARVKQLRKQCDAFSPENLGENERKNVEVLCEAALVLGGKTESALKYYDIALDYCKKYLPENILLQTRIRNNAIGAKKRSPQDSFEEYNAILALREKHLGKNNYHTATTSFNIAANYFNLEDYEQALGYAQRAFNAYKVFGKSNRHRLGLASRLIAQCQSGMANYHDADKYFKLAAMEIAKSKAPGLDLMKVYAAWSRSYAKRKDFKSAIKSAKTALSICEKSIDGASLEKALRLVLVADRIQEEDSGNLEALIYAKRAILEIKRVSNIPDNEIVQIYRRVADVYMNAKQVEMAILFYHRAAEIYRKKLGISTSKKYCLQCLEKLEQLYKSKGNLRKADYYRAEYEKINPPKEAQEKELLEGLK